MVALSIRSSVEAARCPSLVDISFRHVRVAYGSFRSVLVVVNTPVYRRLRCEGGVVRFRSCAPVDRIGARLGSIGARGMPFRGTKVEP